MDERRAPVLMRRRHPRQDPVAGTGNGRGVSRDLVSKAPGELGPRVGMDARDLIAPTLLLDHARGDELRVARSVYLCFEERIPAECFQTMQCRVSWKGAVLGASGARVPWSVIRDG